MTEPALTFMQRAMQEAEKAGAAGEVPVGAVLVDANGQILAVSGNRTESTCDPTAHAEMLVLREAASKQGSPRLENCDLYVTLEPCTMCAAAISFARVRRLYYAAHDAKGGAVDHGARFYQLSTCHHAPEVYGGMMEREAASMLQSFFKERR